MLSRLTVVLLSLLVAVPAVIFWLWLVIQPTRSVCPGECWCDKAGNSVMCQYSGLHSIPLILPTEAQNLEIVGNNITYLENDTFVSKGMVNLHIIDASYCNIRTIELRAFNGLKKLLNLSMTGNEISEIIPGTFENTIGLEYLLLDYNMIEQLGSDVFYGLVNLIFMDLKGNQLQYLHPELLIGLPNLQTLDLSYNVDLQIPTDRHFINSHSLKQLDISACNVSSVSVETFAKVSALEALDLSYNYLWSLDINVMNVLPKLSALNLESNEISELQPGTFETFSCLEKIVLSDNRIEDLESDTFFGLTNLKYVDLKENQLQYLHQDSFRELPNLQTLDLSNNPNLQTQIDRHFTNLRSLKQLNISNCNISSVSVETFANVSALEVLDLSYNYLRILDISMLRLLPELSVLDLENNEIIELKPGTFEKFNPLEKLELSFNRTEHMESDIYFGVANLDYIDLSGNQLQYLHPDAFIVLPYLQTLDLSNNPDLQIPTNRHFINSHSLKQLDISHCNVRSVSDETFANVSALEWLDLSYNYLRILDISILNLLPDLSVLNLERNKISELKPGRIDKHSRLEKLVLSYNTIDHLERDIFFGLSNLEYINLFGNKLQYLHPETFVGLPKLQTLYLSANLGLQIPTDRHFINSHSLKLLDISDCNVSSVSVETFANVSALEWLDLRYNYLRFLDVRLLKSLPRLSAIYLFGNPLHCDCQLQQVWEWCQDHNIETEYRGLVPKCDTPNIETEYDELVPVCDTPSEVKGIWWGVLEKCRCLQGNIQYYGDYKNTSHSYTPIGNMDDFQKTISYITTRLWGASSRYFVTNVNSISVLLFIFGATGNVILIIIIICNKDMRTVPNMYIINLAISDIMYLTSLFLEALTNTVPSYRPPGEIGKVFFLFFPRMLLNLTAYSIAVLSIQRYRAIVNPLHVHASSQPTWRSTGVIIIGVWTVAVLFAIPSARVRYISANYTSLLRINVYQLIALYELLVSCVLPLCVIAFCYIMTARHLVKNSCSVFEVIQNPQQNTRKNTAKVVLGLTVVFVITYVPSHVSQTYINFIINLESLTNNFSEEFEWILAMLKTNVILAYLLSINSCLNPVALFCTSLAFRRHLKRYLTCYFKKKSPPINFELTRRN